MGYIFKHTYFTWKTTNLYYIVRKLSDKVLHFTYLNLLIEFCASLGMIQVSVKLQMHSRPRGVSSEWKSKTTN